MRTHMWRALLHLYAWLLRLIVFLRIEWECFRARGNPGAQESVLLTRLYDHLMDVEYRQLERKRGAHE